jgi:uroporphyrinogen decarboxylase
LKAQINAGAHMVQVFDSWAGILGKDQYAEFGLKYMDQITQSISEVPITVFAKGAYGSLRDISIMDCNTIGIDWNMSIPEIREIVRETKTLQGNLDPCALYSTHDEVERLTNNMLDSFKSKRHIVNLGHGVYPDMDPEKVKTFIKAVKNYEIKY